MKKTIEQLVNHCRIQSVMCCLCLLALPVAVCGQTKDFATWMSFDVEHKLNSKVELSGGLEWRTKDDLNKTDRFGFKVGGSYKLLPFLKLGAGYELHDQNKGDDGWKLRHRYHFDGSLSTRLSRFKLSLRERFQHTFNGHYDEFRLRSRFKLAYDWQEFDCEPYASVEMYNGLGHREDFDVKRMRYRGGVNVAIAKHWDADLFYCRQWEAHKRKDIIGIECTYSF